MNQSYEPPRGNTNSVISEQIRHKPTCIIIIIIIIIMIIIIIIIVIIIIMMTLFKEETQLDKSTLPEGPL